MSDTLLGWHCLAADRRLQFVPHTLVEVGQTLTLPRGVTPALCQTGYHASIRLLDALTYAPSDPGLVCCRVSLEGAIVYDTDKAVASARTCLAMVDADVIVREYACWCAEGALLGLSLRSIPVDERSWQAVVTTRQWLRGEVSAAARDAARDAAWDAARDAARASAWDAAWAAVWAASRDAARASAWAAVWAAARDATRAAVRAAAWAAAWDAVWDAAWAAARDATRASARDAAWDAAWAASRASAWAVMNAELETRMLAAMGRTQ